MKTRDFKKLLKLTDQKAGLVSVNLYKGITKFKKRISQEKLEEAWNSGNWANLNKVIPWENLVEDIYPAVVEVGKSIASAGEIAITALPPNINKRLRWDIHNPIIRKYITDKTSKLVVGINHETQQVIQNAVVRSYTHAMTPRHMAKLIKGSIGLYPAQHVALSNYQLKLMAEGKTGEKLEKLVDQYENKLLDYRAKMIARTEMRAATNMGQISVWRQAANQDLIDKRTAKREWIAEGPDPCPECEEMDGEETGLDEPWIMKDGTQVDIIPIDVHPNCYCASRLII